MCAGQPCACRMIKSKVPAKVLKHYRSKIRSVAAAYSHVCMFLLSARLVCVCMCVSCYLLTCNSTATITSKNICSMQSSKCRSFLI